MKCTIRCELSRIFKMIPILRWKHTMIMIINMTIITFITFIITTLPHPQNNTQHNPQESMVFPWPTPTLWSKISEHHLVMVFCLRFGTWNWPLPFKDNFLEAKLNVGKFPLGNLIVNNMFGHLLFSKWNYVKCSDVLQYHMMAKKKVYYDIQHGSTICCNGHVVTSVTRVVHQVVLFIEIVISYHLLYYIYSIYIYLLLPRVHSVQKKHRNTCFHWTYHKKTESCRKHFWHHEENDNIWFVWVMLNFANMEKTWYTSPAHVLTRILKKRHFVNVCFNLTNIQI